MVNHSNKPKQTSCPPIYEIPFPLQNQCFYAHFLPCATQKETARTGVRGAPFES